MVMFSLFNSVAMNTFNVNLYCQSYRYHNVDLSVIFYREPIQYFNSHSFRAQVTCYLYFLSSPFSGPVKLEVQFWNLPSLKTGYVQRDIRPGNPF